jgi:hypothetical protein
MRFMMMVKADRDSEASVPPSPELVAEMDAWNDELMKSGVLIGGDGLHPSSKGARVRYSKGRTAVIEGPFAETEQLIAGYALFELPSMDEAIELAKQFPNPDNQDYEIEIRQVFEEDDFRDWITPGE